jgi:hypothetical protein
MQLHIIIRLNQQNNPESETDCILGSEADSAVNTLNKKSEQKKRESAVPFRKKNTYC